jgi:hypothetical protein
MKHVCWTLIALLACSPARAGHNFVSNPYLPYPPACAQNAMTGDDTGGRAGAATFFDSEIHLPDYNYKERVPVTLKAWRSPCAEPGRSLIWIEFSLSAAAGNRPRMLEMPVAVADLGGYVRKLLTFAAEPGGWGIGLWLDSVSTFLTNKPLSIDGWSPDNGGRKWLFLLENGPFPDSWDNFFGMTPQEYNAGFKLELNSALSGPVVINVPATVDVLPPAAPGLPLSGQLSGIWVTEGALGQGFQIAISEQVRSFNDQGPGYTDPPLVFFFTHYTFDAENRPIWLTGSVEFEPGAGSVTLPVMRLEKGTFRGGDRADRIVIGEVTITANNCDDLGFEYDYGGLGLGTGQARLKRVHSLETAGHDCRDYTARVAANH